MDDIQTIDDTLRMSPEALSRAPLPGEKYETEQQLARGGMGAIYQAKDLSIRRTVAIKVLLDQDAGEESRARFVEEAQITGQLAHPNIVPVYELETGEDGKLYYAMKLIQGETLKAILKGIRKGKASYLERYPLQRLLTIFLQACNAVAYAHSKGIVHRDLKPDNIMVGDFGEVLVVDWGLVKVLGTEEASPSGDLRSGDSIESVRDSQTMQGGILGTPSYMAPEQAVDSSSVTALADVYAMSAVLYSILTLKPPVKADNVRTILLDVIAGKIDDAGSQENVPAGLAAVAMKGLSRDPDDRYASIPDLQADVERWQAGFATVAESAGAWRQLRLFIVRHRALVAVSFLAVVGIILALSVGLLAAVKERREAEAARQAAVASEAAVREAQTAQRRSQLAASQASAESAMRALDQGRAAEARIRADAAVSILPDGPWGAYALGRVAEERGNPEAAQAHFRQARPTIPIFRKPGWRWGDCARPPTPYRRV